MNFHTCTRVSLPLEAFLYQEIAGLSPFIDSRDAWHVIAEVDASATHIEDSVKVAVYAEVVLTLEGVKCGNQ